MSKIIDAINNEQLNSDIPAFGPGDAVVVQVKIKEGNTVAALQLIGFGTWSVGVRSARTGQNPQTGEKLKIKAAKTVKFKAGAGLKALV